MRGATARGSLLAVLSSLLLLAPAGAQAAGKRIGVPKFEGAQEALVRKKVMAALKAHGYELVRSREVQDAVSSTGASLDSDDGLVTVAKELALSAIVTGEVGPKRAKIVVHDGGEGSILGDASFSGANPRKLAAEVGATFWKKLGPDVGRGHVPAGAKKGQKAAAVSPEDDETAPEGGAAASGDGGGAAAAAPASDSAAPAATADSGDEAAAPKKKKKQRFKMDDQAPAAESTPAAPSGLPWVDLEVGGGGLNRQLSYHQNVVINGSGQLFPYSLGVGPIAVGNAVIYPLDPLVGGLAGNIGLEGEIQQGFAISSNVSNGGSYSNVVHDFAAGGRYRFPFAGSDGLYVSVTGGEDAFTFNGTNRANLLIPDTIYHYVRPGLGFRMLAASGFTLRIAAGYRYIFNSGGPQMLHYFPHLSVAGADADAVLGYQLSSTFEARIGVEWRRYWYNMHSQMGDNYIAGGAVDQSFAFTLRIAILLGSSSGPK
ncbi:MAG TPA: hypothetical protein VHO06_23270, partial [Polyangia bacterium]|nr:hypothetical protein [Polyangia bacterium]